MCHKFLSLAILLEFNVISLDVNDLHKFVSVALHTSAGEGDFANDKLSNLKIIGSGFGPLIYRLKIDPSFETFKISCMSVWESLKSTPNLPRLLVSLIFCLFVYLFEVLA